MGDNNLFSIWREVRVVSANVRALMNGQKQMKDEVAEIKKILTEPLPAPAAVQITLVGAPVPKPFQGRLPMKFRLPDDTHQEFAVGLVDRGGNPVPGDTAGVTLSFSSSDESIAKAVETVDAEGAKHLWFDTGKTGNATVTVSGTDAAGNTLKSDSAEIDVDPSAVAAVGFNLIGGPVDDLPSDQRPV